jgi:hypothetical protein|tara:strand:- start:3265 stop:3828 length:564 start_codon:yes stop_codon:yes gene_type:complete
MFDIVQFNVFLLGNVDPMPCFFQLILVVIPLIALWILKIFFGFVALTAAGLGVGLGIDIALEKLARDPSNSELSYVSKASNTSVQINDNSIDWIDIECKNNKKLYDTKGNIIVIGTPSPKIHTMAIYDINGNIIENSSVKVKRVAKKVIFMDPEDLKDEAGKLKKLYEEGYISKTRYKSLMMDLKNK